MRILVSASNKSIPDESGCSRFGILFILFDAETGKRLGLGALEV